MRWPALRLHYFVAGRPLVTILESRPDGDDAYRYWDVELAAPSIRAVRTYAVGEAGEGFAEIHPDALGSIDKKSVTVLAEEVLEGGKDAFVMRHMGFRPRARRRCLVTSSTPPSSTSVDQVKKRYLAEQLHS